jgi:hypothetical protein
MQTIYVKVKSKDAAGRDQVSIVSAMCMYDKTPRQTVAKLNSMTTSHKMGRTYELSTEAEYKEFQEEMKTIRTEISAIVG